MKDLTANEPPFCDLVIIGAGASGCLLVSYLSEFGFNKKVIIFEAQPHAIDDKVWCFWNQNELPDTLHPLIQHSWDKWRISHQSDIAVHENDSASYCCIRSKALQNYIKTACRDKPNFDLIYDRKIDSVEQLGNQYLLRTNNGYVITDYVIDTRPPKLKEYADYPKTGMYQCFSGVEVKTSKNCFDENCADLMKNLTVLDEGTEFIYILPFSASHALIEYTCFTKYPVSRQQLNERLSAYLDTEFDNIKFERARTESGILPMFDFNKNRHERQRNFIYAGVAGGAMRASTGYSFLNSLRSVKNVARALANESSVKNSEPIPIVYRWMDNVMLSVIHKNPEIAAMILFSFAQQNSPGTFIRFMTERATFLDLLKIIFNMPKKSLFITALFASVFRRNKQAERKICS